MVKGYQMPNKRILVVDDEPLALVSLAAFLQEAGYETVTAPNGELAIQHQKKRPFDVCIVDIRMPGIDGVETILALAEIAPDSRFIVYTGSPQFTLPSVLEKVGLTEQYIVQKPVLDMGIFLTLLG